VSCFWPGGVRHEGGVSPVCCSCMEHGKARFDTALHWVSVYGVVRGERERAQRRKPEALSTDAALPADRPVVAVKAL